MKFSVFVLFVLPALVSAGDWNGPDSELEFARWVTSARGPVSTVHATAGAVTFVPMSDGVKLYTSVYLPQTAGPFPVLLVRTPYNRVVSGEDSYSYRGIADYYVPKGYTVVIQSIRGKYSSEGTYRLLSSGEIDDAYDTIQWISQQSWCNGNVAVMGVSHDGFTALAAGVRNPPALKLILSGGAPADLRTDAFIGGGVPSTSLLDYIAFIETERGQVYENAFFQAYLNNVLREPRLRLHDNKVEKVQLSLWDELIPQLNDPQSEYWRQRRIRDRITQIRVPVIHIAGLTGDGDMPDTVRNYLTMAAAPSIARKQRLILGWWPHSGSGPYADLSNISPYLLDRYNAFLDYYLKGVSSPLVNEKPVRAYSKGQKKWIYADRWPIQAQSAKLVLYLTPDRMLSTRIPGASSPLSYTCNPTVVPSIFRTPVIVPGPDQLVYMSEPMTKDTIILGDASLRVFASTDAKDTDFLALLFKKTIAGQDEELSPTLGRIQARYRTGDYKPPALITPNQVYEYNLPMYPVSNVVKKGERVVLIILSNLNPYIVRNANTGKATGADTQFKSARQKLYHGSQYPSQLLLTVRR